MRTVLQNVQIDPELREHILLSGKEVNDLCVEAATKPDPSAWLSEALNARGRNKKAKMDEHNQRRMEEDKAFILGIERWPDRAACCIKEQPWIKANGRRFGFLFASEVKAGLWIAHVEGEEPETFKSVDELVKVWSVD